VIVLKKIPYGVIDYKKLIESDSIYVDKTIYLSKLENDLINVYTEYPVNGGYADVYIFGRVKPLINRDKVYKEE